MFINFMRRSFLGIVLTGFIGLSAISIPLVSGSLLANAPVAAQKSFIEGIEEHPIILSNHLPVAKGEYNPLNGSIYELLNKAQSSILIFTFTFGDSQTTKILNEKAQNGLKIKIVLDRAHIGNLRILLHPSIEIVTRATGEGHVHHKMLIVDENYIWIGSPNFSAAGILDAKNISIAYSDPLTAALLHHEALCIEGKAKRSSATPLSTYMGNQLIELYIMPHTELKQTPTVEWDLNFLAQTKIIELIDQARTSIKVAMNVWSYKDISRALVKAKQRGVDVQIITIQANITQEALTIMLKEGLSIKYAESHYKWMLVDDSIYMNGSPNWTVNAFSRSDESILFLYDLSQAQLNTVHAIWQNLSK